MLVIRPEQMKSLDAIMLERFESHLVEHVQEHFPTHSHVIGPEQLRKVAQLCIARARAGGYRMERDAFMFLSLMLYLGSHFDSDPQYASVVAALRDDAIGQASDRLEAAYDAVTTYLDEVAGAEGEHVSTAVQRVLSTVVPELRAAPAVNYDYVLQMLDWIWPQKFAHLGEARIRELVQSVLPVAKENGIATPAGACLYVVASFLFGHALERDPQFPWVAQIMSEPGSAQISKAARFEQAFTAQLAAIAA